MQRLGARARSSEGKAHQAIRSRLQRQLTSKSNQLSLEQLIYRQSEPILPAFPEYACKPWLFSKTQKEWWPHIGRGLSHQDPVALAVAGLYLRDLVRFYQGSQTNSDRNLGYQLQFIFTNLSATEKRRIQALGGLGAVSLALGPLSALGSEPVRPATSPPPDKTNKGVHELVLERLRRHIGSTEDWNKFYQVSNSFFSDTRLLSQFNYSAVTVVSVEFPAHQWMPWRFLRSPRHWWKQIAAQLNKSYQKDEAIVAAAALRSYVEDIAEQWRIRLPDQWQLLANRLAVNSNQDLMAERMRMDQLGSVETVLAWLFPGLVPPTPSKPTITPSVQVPITQGRSKWSKLSTEEWREVGTRRDFFKAIAALPSTKPQHLDKLYSLSYRNVLRHGGRKVLTLYNSSVAAAVMHTFPEHTWRAWHFDKTPHGWWGQLGQRLRAGDKSALAQVRSFLTEIAQANKLREWEGLSHQHFTPSVVWRLQQLGGWRAVQLSLHQAPKKKATRSTSNSQSSVLQERGIQFVASVESPSKQLGSATTWTNARCALASPPQLSTAQTSTCRRNLTTRMEHADSAVVAPGPDITDAPPASLLGHRPSFSFGTDGYFSALGNYPAPPAGVLQPMQGIPGLASLPQLPGLSPLMMHRASWSTPTQLVGVPPPDPAHYPPTSAADGDGGEVYPPTISTGPSTPQPEPETRSSKQSRSGDEHSEDDRRHWGTGRKKIQIEFIQNKLKRQITFSKRKTGMLKKIQELTTLTGTQALLVLVSETGHVYNFATPKLLSLVADDDNNPIKKALRSWNVETKQYRDMV